MGFRWSDFDFEHRRVAWRAEHDKKKRSWLVSYSDEFFNIVREFQRRLGAVGGLVFARGDDAELPAPSELLSQRIRQAEEAAGLPKSSVGRVTRTAGSGARSGRTTRSRP
ncbi:MAG: hypothetical protein JWM41_1110 [Gemmatimonadetes bacterium]|nr:hypothetical protein [Gemmatimonadota bacterium]